MSKINISTTPVAPTSGTECADGSKTFDQPRLIRQSGYYDDTKSLSDYVLIKRGNLAAGDVKPLVEKPLEKPSLGTSSSRPAFGTGKGRVKIPILRTRLAYNSVTTSAANSVNNAVTNVDPTLSTEWATFTSLFDEMKVIGGEVHYRISPGGGPTASTAEAILAYDPIDSGVYTSVDAAMVASQRDAPLQVAPLGPAAAAAGCPVPYTRTGNWIFKFKCPEGPSKVASTTAADARVATGNWVSMSGSSNAFYGFLKPFVSVYGGTGTSTIDMHIVLDCLFRSRT